MMVDRYEEYKYNNRKRETGHLGSRMALPQSSTDSQLPWKTSMGNKSVGNRTGLSNTDHL